MNEREREREKERNKEGKKSAVSRWTGLCTLFGELSALDSLGSCFCGSCCTSVNAWRVSRRHPRNTALHREVGRMGSRYINYSHNLYFLRLVARLLLPVHCCHVRSLSTRTKCLGKGPASLSFHVYCCGAKWSWEHTYTHTLRVGSHFHHIINTLGGFS